MAMPDLHRETEREKTLRNWADEIVVWRINQGFFQPVSISGPIHSDFTRTDPETGEADISMTDINLSRLMLVTTEIAEAAEAVRKGDWDNYVEELADTFIRLLDITGSQGIDIDAAIAAKMEKNRQRPRKHGKRA